MMYENILKHLNYKIDFKLKKKKKKKIVIMSVDKEMIGHDAMFFQPFRTSAITLAGLPLVLRAPNILETTKRTPECFLFSGTDKHKGKRRTFTTATALQKVCV